MLSQVSVDTLREVGRVVKTHTNLATYALVSIETVQLKHAHKYAFVRLFKPSRDFAECTFLKRVCYSCRTVCVFITVRHAISVKHNPFLVHLCLQENENAVFRCYVFHFGAQFFIFSNTFKPAHAW